MFDVQGFMQTVVDSASSTKYINPPDLDDAIGQIKKVDGREIVTATNPKQVVVDITFDMIDDRVKEHTHRENGNNARYSVFIDTTPGGGLDMGEGKNVKLGKLREAVGQNTPGEPWAFSMLIDKTCRCKLVNRTAEDGQEYCDVKAVIPL